MLVALKPDIIAPQTPPSQHQTEHCGNKRNLQEGKSGLVSFWYTIRWVPDPLPPSTIPLSNSRLPQAQGLCPLSLPST